MCGLPCEEVTYYVYGAQINFLFYIFFADPKKKKKRIKSLNSIFPCQYHYFVIGATTMDMNYWLVELLTVVFKNNNLKKNYWNFCCLWREFSMSHDSIAVIFFSWAVSIVVELETYSFFHPLFSLFYYS